MKEEDYKKGEGLTLFLPRAWITKAKRLKKRTDPVQLNNASHWTRGWVGLFLSLYTKEKEKDSKFLGTNNCFPQVGVE